MAHVLSSLSEGEAGWTLTSCLCRGDTDWGLIASPHSSALALFCLDFFKEYAVNSLPVPIYSSCSSCQEVLEHGCLRAVGLTPGSLTRCTQMLWMPLGRCWSHTSTFGEEKAFLSAPSFALCQSFPPWSGQMFLQQCSPELEVTGIMEPLGAFTLRVFGKHQNLAHLLLTFLDVKTKVLHE